MMNNSNIDNNASNIDNNTSNIDNSNEKKQEQTKQEDNMIDTMIHNSNARDISQLQAMMNNTTSDSLMDTLSEYLSNPDNVIKTGDLTLSKKIGDIMDRILRIRMRAKIITDELSKPENIKNEQISNIIKDDYETLLKKETNENIKM